MNSVANMFTIVLLLMGVMGMSEAMLSLPVGTTSQQTPNISCYDLMNTTVGPRNGAKYCVITEAINPMNVTFYVRDIIYSDWIYLNDNTTAIFIDYIFYMPKKYGWIRMSRVRCTGFSSATVDVGYGPCTILPYESFRNLTLCICATNDCNRNMTACQSSVNVNQPSPLLVPLFSTFNTTISCVDTHNYSMCAMSYGLTYALAWYINYPACYAYMAMNTVMCSINIWGHKASQLLETYDASASYGWRQVNLGAFMRGQQLHVYQSTTNILFFVPSPNGTAALWVECYCTTNYCNANLSTCASGLNFNPQALYGVNSTLSSTSMSTSPTTAMTGTTNATQLFSTSVFGTTPQSTLTTIGSTAGVSRNPNARSTADHLFCRHVTLIIALIFS